MNLNPIVLSIPVFFLLIGVELAIERISHRKLYRLPDAIANLSCGITQQLSGLFLRVFAIGVYEVLHFNARLHTFTDDQKNWIYWLSLFLLVDFTYYWAHRMSHEINLFWGGHVVHHQSEEYNLSVALRQSSFQVVWTFMFSLPLAFIGFDTYDFALISAFNTLYQFWIHTETIGRMGWFEYVFNTPSHHRVHHGRDPKYIDKNHAGTLIIWDKVFGTFQKEEEKPIYGITKPVKSWNAAWVNFSHYSTMATELRLITHWKDKIRYLFSKPGWMPASLGGYRPAPLVERGSYKKFETPYQLRLGYYVLFQYGMALALTAWFLFNQSTFSFVQKALIAAAISLWVVNCGVLFEKRKWVKISEWVRILVFSSIGFMAVFFFRQPLAIALIAAVYFMASSLWFYRINSQ